MYLQKLNYLTKRDERLGIYSAVSALNQTDKDIKKQQFDFSMKATKNNTTLQYETAKNPSRPLTKNLSSRKSNLNLIII